MFLSIRCAKRSIIGSVSILGVEDCGFKSAALNLGSIKVVHMSAKHKFMGSNPIPSFTYVTEMVDVLDLKFNICKDVRVQVPP